MSTALEIQSRFKKSACGGVQASPCSVIQMLFLKLKRAEEGVYICVSVCVSMHRCVCVSVVHV